MERDVVARKKEKDGITARRVASYLLLVVAASSALMLWKSRSALLKSNSDDTKAAVLAAIPIGTPLSEARSLMQSEGMVCRASKNKLYAVYPQKGSNPISRGPADFLWCDYEANGFLARRRWQVIFVEKGGFVTEVSVSVGLISL